MQRRLDLAELDAVAAALDLRVRPAEEVDEAVGSAALMITDRNPVYAALWFAVTTLAGCGLFLLSSAPFLAAACAGSATPLSSLLPAVNW